MVTFTKSKNPPSEKCGTATPQTKTPNPRKTAEAEDQILKDLGNTVLNMNRRDSLISVELSSLDPDDNNSRFGQKELLENIPALQKFLTRYKAVERCIPDYTTLQVFCEKQSLGTPLFSKAAQRLYNNCAALANTYLEGEGYADNPIKVYPPEEGRSLIKTGHRRYISQLLSEPFTGVTCVDVVVDKSSGRRKDVTVEELAAVRIRENTSREGNNLGEQLHSLKPIVEASLQKTGKPPNKAQLSRQVGIERSQLTRMINMVMCGAAKKIDTLYALDDLEIKDVTAAELLFKQPEAEWSSLMEKLSSIGPTEFRRLYQNIFTDNSNTDRSTDTGENSSNDVEQTETVITATDQTVGQVESNNRTEKPKGTKSSTSGAGKADVLEVGARTVLDIIAQVDKTLVETLPAGSAYKRLQALLTNLGKQQ